MKKGLGKEWYLFRIKMPCHGDKIQTMPSSAPFASAGAPINLQTIQASALTFTVKDDKIGVFYSQAKECIDMIPKHDVLLITGDFKHIYAGRVFEQIKMGNVNWKKSMNKNSDSLSFVPKTRFPLTTTYFSFTFCGRNLEILQISSI